MDIVNHSRLTRELEVKMSRKLFWKQQTKTIAIVEIVLVAAIALVLGVYIDKFYLAIIFGAIMIGFPIFLVVALKKAEQGTYNPNEGFEELDVDFHFHEAIMDVYISANGVASPTIYQAYNDCVAIFDTKDVLVFMLATRQAFFVVKDGFKKEEDLNKVLEMVKQLPMYKKM